MLRSSIFVFALLVFACQKELNYQIDNVRQVSFNGDNGEAYLSDDQTRLVFQSKRDGNDCDKLYTVNFDGTNLQEFELKDGAFTCAYFSLKDKYMFFSSTMKDGPNCPEIYKHPNPRKYIWPLRNYEIFRWDGESSKQLTNFPGYNAEATIHPKEERIIFTSMRDGDIDLYSMDYEGKNLTRITSEYGYDGGAFYSPNGKQIVWRAWYPSTEEEKNKWSNNLEKKYIEAVPLDIYIANSDGTDKIRLTENGATNWSPSWHPDGKHIIFSSNMDDWRDDYNAYGSNFELYLINIQSRKISRLTDNNTFDSFPVFTKNGRHIIFSSNRDAQNPRNTNIFIADILDK